MRPNYTDLSPSLWTPEEANYHLKLTFNSSVEMWPDIMEPYVVMLADCSSPEEKVEIMRRGLRETVKERFRSPDKSRAPPHGDKVEP
jgi:hypothetical protein